MDFLKKKLGHKDQKEQDQGQKAQPQSQDATQKSQTSSFGQQAGEQKPDYVDKAFDAGAQKAGYNIDPNTRENITDKGREAFEKATGKDVPDKVSN